jgi:TPR repeat protein
MWLAAAVCITGATPQALPPLYTLVDVGEVQVPACPCVTSPFMLPSYRPGLGYGEGPATPSVDAPHAQADPQRHREEQAAAARDAEHGLAGNPSSSFGVGLYLSERAFIAGGDARTEEEAARWLHLAAQQGVPDASMSLAHRYLRGRGVKQDDAAAAFWFDDAARKGNNVGMVAIGLLYAAGRGVPQDWDAAVWWWRKAQPTTPLASRLLGDAYVCGLGVAANNEQAVLAYRKSADSGDLTGSIQLGHMYANGCASPDDESAVKAYRRAADAGYPEAQVALSDLIRTGRGGPPNPAEAYYWAKVAELRLRDGAQRQRAAAAAKAAARLMSVDEVAAAEQIVKTILADGAKPLR